MSGFEIAGLVLGAIPILITAVDQLHSGSQRIRVPFKKRAITRQLSRELIFQTQILTETVRSFAVHSGCSNYASQPIPGSDGHDEDWYAYLQNEDVQENILAFLGMRNHAAFHGKLEEVREIVVTIMSQLDGIVQINENQPDDLCYIIRANRDAPANQIDFIARTKLMFRVNDLKTSINDLNTASASLDRFRQLVLENRNSIPLLAAPRSTNPRLYKRFRSIAMLAADLYAALCRACWNGICHTEHVVNLLLEDRLTNVSDSVSAVVFKLIFGATSVLSNPSLWFELPVKVVDTDKGAADISHATATARVRFAFPQAVAQPPFTPVHDFCTTVSESSDAPKPVGFVLNKSRQIGTTTAARGTVLRHDRDCRIKLAAILSKAPNVSFPLRLRMLLAWNLASNLLQLSQTRWVLEPWTKETVYFLHRPASHSRHLVADFAHAFVSAELAETENDAGAESTPPVDGKTILLELGILLLELWHLKTIEARFDRDAAPSGYYGRLSMAVEWLNDIDNPPLGLYETAISHCVRGAMGNGRQRSDWGTDTLCSEIHAEVVEPLLKNCKQWR